MVGAEDEGMAGILVEDGVWELLELLDRCEEECREECLVEDEREDEGGVGKFVGEVTERGWSTRAARAAGSTVMKI